MKKTKSEKKKKKNPTFSDDSCRKSIDQTVIQLRSEMVSEIELHNSSWGKRTDFIRAV